MQYSRKENLYLALEAYSKLLPYENVSSKKYGIVLYFSDRAVTRTYLHGWGVSGSQGAKSIVKIFRYIV